MYSIIKSIIELLDKKSKNQIYIFSFFRILLGLLDLVGVLLVGLLLARSVNSNNSNGDFNGFKLPEYLDFLNSWNLIQIAAFATAAFISKSLLSALITKLMMNKFAQIEVNVSIKTFDYLLKNIAWTVKNYSKSDINFILGVSIISSMQMLAAYVVILSELFFLIFMLISFSFINFTVTIFILIYFSFIAFTLHGYLGKRFEVAGKNGAEAGIQSTATILDSIESFREIISFKRENYFLDRFRKPRYEQSKASFDIQFLNTLPRYIVESALLLGALGIIFLSFRSENIQESAQSIGVFLTGATKIMASLLPLQTYAAYFRHQIEMAQKFLNFEATTGANKNSRNNFLVSKNRNNNLLGPIGIEIKNLSFYYDSSNNLALNNLNIKIQPGQFVAVIGPSGSGKSTLADLIIGVLHPSEGKIEFVSADGKYLTNEEVRFGYVPQHPGKVQGTVMDNIAFGVQESEIDLVNLNFAVNKAHLDELISSLEQGLNTYLGEQANSLSGGQMQRIGLARALYENPNLLLLDEATSALDVETEVAVTESLENFRKKCTMIVIAHRLSTVQNADLVLVIDEGKLVGQGKFSELIQSNDIVSKYVELSELKTS